MPGIVRHLRRATAFWRALPDVLVIGAQRCGTTSLYRYLCEHPEFRPAARKEVHFFDSNYHRGLRWYRAQFPLRRRGEAGRWITGEASPFYLYHPAVPARVRAVLPEVRLIAMLRNPVDRAFSHYHLSVRRGVETLSFEEAIEREPERLGGLEGLERDPEKRRRHRQFAYLARGRYAEQLERWLALFPRDRLLVICSERFYAEPAETMERVFAFLGVSVHHPGQYRPHNIGRYAEMAPETRRRLAERFAPENRRLYALLGESFDWEDDVS